MSGRLLQTLKRSLPGQSRIVQASAGVTCWVGSTAVFVRLKAILHWLNGPCRPTRFYGWWWWYSCNRPHLTDRSHIEILEELPANAVGLDLGAGGKRIRPNAITTDIQALPGVDVVCDATALAFEDNKFDYVWSNAVLEHVREPWKVAAEIARVLKPGGVAIIHTPFLEYVHGWPDDYYRFTIQGLRVLFKGLEELKTGTSAGPGQVLPDLIQYYFAGFGDLVNGGFWPTLWCVCVGIWLLPLRWLDRWLCRRPSYWRWARAYYYVGRKPAGKLDAS
jgi:SAM-dependent methyltransferase